MRVQTVGAGLILSALALNTTAVGAEKPREETAFRMSETSVYLASKKVDAKAVQDWVKQLRNITLLDSGCDYKAMVKAFQSELPARAYETVSDRIGRFREKFPGIATPQNPKGMYRCIVEFSRPSSDGKERKDFRYLDYKNELSIELYPVSRFSKPYELSEFTGQNSFGASTKVTRATFDWERVETSSNDFDGSRPTTEYQFVGNFYTVRISADRKKAADLESSLYVYSIVDMSYPYFTFEMTKDDATLKQPTEATFNNYKVHVRPRFVIVGDLFSKYIKVFDVTKCVQAFKSERIISEQNCR